MCINGKETNPTQSIFDSAEKKTAFTIDQTESVVSQFTAEQYNFSGGQLKNITVQSPEIITDIF